MENAWKNNEPWVVEKRASAPCEIPFDNIRSYNISNS